MACGYFGTVRPLVSAPLERRIGALQDAEAIISLE